MTNNDLKSSELHTNVLIIGGGPAAKDLAEFSYSSQPWQTFFPAKNAIVEAASSAQTRLS